MAKLLHEENGDFADYGQEVRDREAERDVQRSISASHRELERRLSSDIPKAKKNRDANRQMRGDESKAADLIDELGLVLDAFLLDVIDHDVRNITEPLHLTTTNILQAGLTTTYAITLLLKNGYVVDADARWRGLYELTCQAAVLAKASDHKESALRYLMHGQQDLARGRLNVQDLNAGENIVQQERLRGSSGRGPYWEGSYQWIPAELLKDGAPQKKIYQWELWELADLKVAPSSLVQDSHKSVHMSSLVVTSESAVALDNDPGGYDPALEEDIAIRTAKTLYELVAHCCLLADNLQTDNSYPAWEQEFYERVRETVEKLS